MPLYSYGLRVSENAIGLVWNNHTLILDRTDAESVGSDRVFKNALIAVMSMPLYSYGLRVSENVIGLVWNNHILILDRTDTESVDSDRVFKNALIAVM